MSVSFFIENQEQELTIEDEDKENVDDSLNEDEEVADTMADNDSGDGTISGDSSAAYRYR